MGGFAFTALSVWLAVVAARRFEESPEAIGAAIGLAQIISAGGGFLLSLLVTRLFATRWGSTLPPRMLWMGMAGAAIILIALPWASKASHLYALYAAAGVSLTFATMAFPTVLQTIAPAHARGRVASVQFIVSMVIASMAPPLVGALSDRLGPAPNMPQLAMAVVIVPALFLGALIIRSCEGERLNVMIADAAKI